MSGSNTLYPADTVDAKGISAIYLNTLIIISGTITFYCLIEV